MEHVTSTDLVYHLLWCDKYFVYCVPCQIVFTYHCNIDHVPLPCIIIVIIIIIHLPFFFLIIVSGIMCHVTCISMSVSIKSWNHVSSRTYHLSSIIYHLSSIIICFLSSIIYLVSRITCHVPGTTCIYRYLRKQDFRLETSKSNHGTSSISDRRIVSKSRSVPSSECAGSGMLSLGKKKCPHHQLGVLTQQESNGHPNEVSPASFCWNHSLLYNTKMY